MISKVQLFSFDLMGSSYDKARAPSQFLRTVPESHISACTICPKFISS